MRAAELAKELRIGERSVWRWCRVWAGGGPGALWSEGLAVLLCLRWELFAVLGRELAEGPAVHGWPDLMRALERIRTLVGCRFCRSCTVLGVYCLFKWHGWGCKMPARRAVGRDGDAVVGWVEGAWPQAE